MSKSKEILATTKIDETERFDSPELSGIKALTKEGRELAYAPRQGCGQRLDSDDPVNGTDARQDSNKPKSSDNPSSEDAVTREEAKRNHQLAVHWYREIMRSFIQREFNNTSPNASDLAKVNVALEKAHTYNSPLAGVLERLQAMLKEKLIRQTTESQ